MDTFYSNIKNFFTRPSDEPVFLSLHSYAISPTQSQISHICTAADWVYWLCHSLTTFAKFSAPRSCQTAEANADNGKWSLSSWITRGTRMDFEAGYNPDSVVALLRNGRPIIFETAEIKAKEW